MKFYQRRGVALVVLILAILGASFYGISKRPAPLPKVEYYNWIADEAGLLSAATEDTIRSYNTAWNDKYYAVVAVAAVDDIRGWKAEDFAYDLGEKWGLGANDMLLLLVEDDHYYVALGDNLLTMTDTQESKLRTAIEEDYYKGDFDAAVVSFFRQVDVFYAQMAASSAYTGPNYEWVGGGNGGAETSVFGVIVVVALLFLVWAMLDKVRYNRYQRRVRITPGIVYYPIFWGRPRRVVTPVAPVAPPRPVQHTYRPSGSVQPPRSSTTVYRSNPTGSRPSSGRSTSSSRNSFGNGGFGGGSRSGGSSRGSSRGGSRGGGFGGGRR